MIQKKENSLDLNYHFCITKLKDAELEIKRNTLL